MSETGELWLVYVDKTPVTSSYENPDWQLIGGQKGLDFGRTLATADATTKGSNSNEETLTTIRSHDISMDTLYQADDAGLAVLESMFLNKAARAVKIDNGVLQYKMMAWCTAFPISAPFDDVVSSAITLKPTGAIERTPALTV